MDEDRENSYHSIVSEAFHHCSMASFWYNFVGVGSQPNLITPAVPPLDKMNQVARLDNYLYLSSLAMETRRYDDALWLLDKALDSGNKTESHVALAETKKVRVRLRMAKINMEIGNALLSVCRFGGKMDGRSVADVEFNAIAAYQEVVLRQTGGLTCNGALRIAELRYEEVSRENVLCSS